jgi:hypothetical protein
MDSVQELSGQFAQIGFWGVEDGDGYSDLWSYLRAHLFSL